ncbi:UNVERIFIED_CONTAM: Retrovirus-related Pol polyprotein from transposon RE2 [Sesamum radiatum]|uniref:Retrovirus-related Pol polyprotein from transposon RE2 n=1 Tax=Sesamum radiatum TaxID=300843 RepID=A0AAW2RZA6_SESRA
MDAALHLIRYLKGCHDRGLFFPSSNSFVIRVYCGADWTSFVDSRMSLTGYCIFLGDALISWKTKKQPTVARSTAEADYRSLGSTASGFVLSSHISGKTQLAELFTKTLPRHAFLQFLSKMGLVSLPQVHLEGGLKKVGRSIAAVAMDDDMG